MARLQAELDCRDSSSLCFGFVHVAAVTVLMLMMHDDTDHYLSHDQEANGVALTIPVTVIIIIVDNGSSNNIGSSGNSGGSDEL